MAEDREARVDLVDRLPLLRGRITAVDTYEAPQRGGGSLPALPSPDPATHRERLLRQLDAIRQQVQARSDTARDELASREIIAVRPAPDAALTADQLDDARADARLVGLVAETGVVLLDVASPDFDYLRKKLEAFADDTKVEIKTHKDGSRTIHRDKERAIAPVDTIGLAAFDDVAGTQLRAEALLPDRAYWLEVACRGGYRRPLSETEGSRSQIARQLHRIGALQKLDEFVGPEQVYFFLRLTSSQLDALRASTDCIYEVELAPQRLRDLKLLEDVTTKDLVTFALAQPNADAPSVVVLDTGIASEHPLLKAAILSATTAGQDIQSPEDTYGHGTKMAGLALHRDLGAAIKRGSAQPTHWIQSSRLLIEPGLGLASDDNYEKWPVLTEGLPRSARRESQRSLSRTPCPTRSSKRH